MMRTEGGGVVERMRRCSSSDHRDRVDDRTVMMKKKRGSCSKRIRLRRPNLEIVSTLQRLFDSCKHVFKGPGTVPSIADVQNLCYILDGMKPEDVGLSKDLQFFKPKSELEVPPRVTSATIYKGPNFELSIFFIPEGGVIPLHNHPEMTVFSKLLLGTMHIKAYDWLHSEPTSSKRRKAKLKANTTFTAPCDTSVLYPTSGGNIHEFRAITACAVLDVIGPPYSKDDGRECSFYKEIPVPHTLISDEEEKITKDDVKVSWLDEIEIPRESQMDGIQYMGPQINDPTS